MLPCCNVVLLHISNGDGVVSVVTCCLLCHLTMVRHHSVFRDLAVLRYLSFSVQSSCSVTLSFVQCSVILQCYVIFRSVFRDLAVLRYLSFSVPSPCSVTLSFVQCSVTLQCSLTLQYCLMLQCLVMLGCCVR